MFYTSPILAISTLTIVLIVIVAVLAAACVALYIFGKRTEKKQAAQEENLKANAQVFSLYVIDKKKMKINEAGLPSAVMEQTPWYAKRAKLPIVKAKIGPRVMSLIADTKIYDQILPKQEIKANVSGLYITSFKRIRGPIYEPPKKKKRFAAFRR